MKLVFDIEPIAQARPKATRAGRGIRLYDPPTTALFKRQLRLLAQARHVRPIQDALAVEIWFYRPVQKAISHKERVRRINGEVNPTVKPDTDNYIKSTLDALNGVLWRDDAQTIDLNTHKRYSDHPRIEMKVEALK